jgi:hypothetical protein
MSFVTSRALMQPFYNRNVGSTKEYDKRYEEIFGEYKPKQWVDETRKEKSEVQEMGE